MNHNLVYAAFIVLSFISGFLFVYFKSNKNKEVIWAELTGFVLAIFGAIAYTYITQGTFGLSSCGALLGFIAGVFIYKQKSKSINTDLFMLSIPLIYGVSKLACAFKGCCRGFLYSGPLHITYAGQNHFPIQIFETILFLTVFADSYLIYKKTKNIYWTVFLSAMMKFSVELLRENAHFPNANMIISLAFLMFAIFKLIKGYDKNATNISNRTQP